MSGRVRQILLLVTFIPWCWLMMMVVHEAGHVLAAWCTGATIERVVLHPLAISQTVLGENPQPLIVSWFGPVFGSLLPVMVWLLFWVLRSRVAPFVRFFAGFCLVANGAYIGIGGIFGDGDAGDLIHAGALGWHLAIFGVGASSCGLWFWHGLAPAFGLREPKDQITWRTSLFSTFLLVITMSLELLLSSLTVSHQESGHRDE